MEGLKKFTTISTITLPANQASQNTATERVSLTQEPDTVELSTQQEKKQNNKKLAIIGASIVGIGAAIFGIAKLLKNPASAGKNVTENTESLGRKTQEAAEELADKGKKKLDEVVDEISGQASHNEALTKEAEEAQKAAEATEKMQEEARLAALEAQKIAEKKTKITNVLKEKNINAELDDETLQILERIFANDQYTSSIGLGYAIKHALIQEPNKISAEILKIAEGVTDAAQKEKLLIKAYSFFPEKYPEYYTPTHLFEDLEQVYTGFNSQYKVTNSKEFKAFFEEKIQPKFMEHFNNLDKVKALKENFNIECDYDLYKELLNRSKTYKNIFRDQYDAMFWVNSKSEAPKVRSFLIDSISEIARKEKDPLRKESLLFNKLHLTQQDYKGSNIFIYDEILALNNFYAHNSGEKFVHQEAVQKEMKKLVDDYLEKFEIPGITSGEDRLKVVENLLRYGSNNRQFDSLTKFDDVLTGLTRAAMNENSEKFYKAAVDFAEQQNARVSAIKVIEEIEQNAELSQPFKDAMKARKTQFNEAIKKLSNDVADALNAKTLEQAFDEISQTNALKDAIAKVASRAQLSTVDAINKMKAGDGNIIHGVVSSAAFEMRKDPKALDNLINYITKADDIVTDSLQREYLQNIKLNLLGEKHRLGSHEEQAIYHNILKEEIKNILFGKGTGNSVSEKIEIDDTVISNIAKQIEDGYYFIDEVLPAAMNEVLLKYGFGTSAETEKIFMSKFNDMKTRLNYKTEEDFFEEFKRFFGGGNSSSHASKASKPQGLEILNKYLDDGEKLTQDSTPGEIKKAYRKLALKFHPDKYQDPVKQAEVTEIFKDISSAYEAFR